MADVTNIVDPDNDTGTDYTSLNAWEAQNLNLVTAADTETAECRSSSGSADTTGPTLAGWTTSSTYDITIQSTGANRSAGVWDTDLYRLDVQDDASGAIELDESTIHITFDGLQMRNHTITANGRSVINSGTAHDSGSYIDVIGCIIVGSASTSYWSYLIGFGRSGSVSDHLIRNTVIYDIPTTGTGIYLRCNTATLQNVTVYGGDRGVRSVTGTCTATNCAVIGQLDEAFVGTWSGDYNCSDDTGDAPGANSVDTTQTDAELFTDASADDFSVADTDSDLYDVGSDLSGTFTDDIAGTTRSTWDIGAFEYVSAATGVTVSVSANSADGTLGSLSVSGEALTALSALIGTSTPVTLANVQGDAIAALNAIVSTGSPAGLTVFGEAIEVLNALGATGAAVTVLVDVGGSSETVPLSAISAAGSAPGVAISAGALEVLSAIAAAGSAPGVTVTGDALEVLNALAGTGTPVAVIIAAAGEVIVPLGVISAGGAVVPLANVIGDAVTTLTAQEGASTVPGIVSTGEALAALSALAGSGTAVPVATIGEAVAILSAIAGTGTSLSPNVFVDGLFVDGPDFVLFLPAASHDLTVAGNTFVLILPKTDHEVEG